MPDYRLIFTDEPDDSPGKSIFFTADNAAAALLHAQRHESPAQLWADGKRLCTLSRPAEGAFWVVS